MRNLEERIAEIDRRSEKIIKERRKRWGYIRTACIPVVLCVSISATFILPDLMMHRASGEGEGESWDSTGNKNQSVASSVVMVQVTGGAGTRIFTEDARVLEISKQLNALDAVYFYSSSTDNSIREDLTDDSIRGPSGPGTGTDIFTDCVGLGTTITLTMHDGKTVELYLLGTRLENRTTQKIYSISRQELAKLQEVLWISRESSD